MDEADKNGSDGDGPECLLPYDLWTENALRQVMASALRHVAHEGLPGKHLFHISFRTDHPGTDISPRLRAKCPEYIDLELHEDFWDLKVDDETGRFSVGAAFDGDPFTLSVPLEAVTYFADPSVGLRLRFQAPQRPSPESASAEEPPPPDAPSPAPAESQVVSLDAFRRRPPSKES